MTCCEDMGYALDPQCDMHGKNCPETLIWRFSSGEYGIPIGDGGSSIKQIHFCPWCGAKLAVASGTCAPLTTT